MERKAVDSSNIASVGYDAANKILEVEFKVGSIYQYSDVPPDLAEKMVKAESPGRFLNQYVKPVFSGKRVGAAA